MLLEALHLPQIEATRAGTGRAYQTARACHQTTIARPQVGLIEPARDDFASENGIPKTLHLDIYV